ncbi:hypothetical protein EON67_04420 [archaeon]|nr:MAG: hypothetical protein EON67_04420 [archaeon]
MRAGACVPGCAPERARRSVRAHAARACVERRRVHVCAWTRVLRAAKRRVQISRRLPLTRKKVDDVLGGDKAWETVDQTDAVCPHCDNRRAYFMQIQIRSADEPMTIFYRCTACKKHWSSN